MPAQYNFECTYCGLEFGSDVVELAIHIRRVHDPPRGKDWVNSSEMQ